MYQVKDYVVYGANGVCQVVDICLENFGGKEDREYYVLSPVYGNSMSIFIPTDHENAQVRQVHSKDEIMDLIRQMPQMDGQWIDDDHHRRAVFSDTLQSCDLYRTARLIKMLYLRKQALEQQGKHLSSTDGDAMKAAEKLLCHEFALVLDIEPDDVVPFIAEKIVEEASVPAGRSIS